jgi:hypothetical protein
MGSTPSQYSPSAYSTHHPLIAVKYDSLLILPVLILLLIILGLVNDILAIVMPDTDDVATEDVCACAWVYTEGVVAKDCVYML